MKRTVALIVLSLFVIQTAEAQRRKSGQSRTPTRKPQPTAPAASVARIIGTQVTLITKNGDQIPGTLLELTAFSARIKQGNLESTIALDTLASISFVALKPPTIPEQKVAVRPEFQSEAQSALNAFQATADSLKAGTDYTEFGRQLAETRRVAERVIAKYGATENKSEARAVALFAATLTDYNWARTIWTLKFGRSGDGTVNDTDSPAVTDALSLYPDLRAAAASGNKFAVDKLVAGLWRKAAEKIDTARATISGPR
jgi:hypothetical protein